MRIPGGVISTTMKLKILRDLVGQDCKVSCGGAYQLVAVPKAAPFVRIAMELISVGYS